MRNHKRQLYLFLYVSLLIVISSFTVLFINFQKQVKLQKEVLKIQAALITVDSVTNTLLQAETDKRGYQLTGDVAFLKNYYAIKNACRHNAATLRSHDVIQIDPAILPLIDSLLELRIANLDSGIIVFTTKGFTAAADFMQLRSKKDIRDQLDQKLWTYKTYLSDQLTANTTGINKRSRDNLNGLIVLVSIFILLMIFAAITFRRAQKKVAKNKNKFKEAQRIAQIGSWEWDIGTNKLNWSQEQYRLFGESRAHFDLTHDGYLRHFSEEEKNNTVALLKEVLAGNTKFEIEHEIIRLDGSVRMVFEQGTVLYDESHKPVRMFGTTQDITDRKNAEEKIKAERQLLRTLIDNIPDSIFIKDTAGRKIMANKGNMDFMGTRTEADFMGKTDLELFPDTGGAEGYKNDMTVIETGQPVINIAEEFVDIKGQQRWLLTSKMPLYDSEGKFTGLLGIGRDITQRKKAESELLEAQKKYQDIFNHTVDGIYQSTVDGKFIMANRSMAKIFGYDSPDDLIRSVTHIDQQIYAVPAERKKMSALLLRQGYINDFKFRGLTKKGDTIWVSENIHVIPGKNGDPCYFEGTLEDITERTKSEEQLLNLSNRLQLAVRATSIGIWDWDMINNTTLWDEEMYHIYDVDPADPRSITEAWEACLHPDDLERVNEELQMAARDEKDYDTEFRIIWKDKTIHYVKGHALVERDETGKALRMIGTNTDITERKQAEEEILQLNRDLDQFANITAHDLQEPIRMVSGFLGLLHKKYNDFIDEQGKSYIYRAKDGADRMSILIKDLLEFSRSGNKAAKKELVDLGYVMDLVDKDLSIVMADTGTILRIPSSLPEVTGTQSSLYRLFLNLVSNGIKFRKKDAVPEVNLSVHELPDCWEFTLQDNGIGIAEKDQPKLFQAFQRLHRREEYPGTGLGLVTCKKIVEIHGGKIWITSEEGKGTAFHFTIKKNDGNFQTEGAFVAMAGNRTT